MSKPHKSQPFRTTADTQAYRTARCIEYIFAIELGVLQTAAVQWLSAVLEPTRPLSAVG